MAFAAGVAAFALVAVALAVAESGLFAAIFGAACVAAVIAIARRWGVAYAVPSAQWEQAVEYLATVVMRLPAWYAAFDEVKGHRAQAGGDADAARDHFRTAAAGFGASGQPLDEARCTALAASLRPGRPAGNVSGTP